MTPSRCNESAWDGVTCELSVGHGGKHYATLPGGRVEWLVGLEVAELKLAELLGPDECIGCGGRFTATRRDVVPMCGDCRGGS